MEELKRMQFNTETKAKEDGSIEVIVNSGKADRVNEILDVDGIDLGNYKKNPVVLFGHDYTQPPIGRASKIWKDTKGLMARIDFASEVYPFAKLIEDLMREGYQKAVSIGFIPKEAEENKKGELVFTQSEMLEFSVVPVPADPKALLTAKGLGFKKVKSVLEGKISVEEFNKENKRTEKECLEDAPIEYTKWFNKEGKEIDPEKWDEMGLKEYEVHYMPLDMEEPIDKALEQTSKAIEIAKELSQSGRSDNDKLLKAKRAVQIANQTAEVVVRMLKKKIKKIKGE